MRLQSVFSTSVEVFLIITPKRESIFGLLHVRGGVSMNAGTLSAKALSSPRPWRCFFARAAEGLRVCVFSTSVEVFLVNFALGISVIGLLHVRGGVSKKSPERIHAPGSSPRPWRCFHECRNAIRKSPVFSTSVEVFLCACCRRSSRMRLLHVRGGVS